jgi:hypothetical protein
MQQSPGDRSHITKHLFIGGRAAATDVLWLEQCNIRFVLTCACELMIPHVEGVVYELLPVWDRDTEQLFQGPDWERALAFLRRVWAHNVPGTYNGGNLLVHAEPGLAGAPAWCWLHS